MFFYSNYNKLINQVISLISFTHTSYNPPSINKIEKLYNFSQNTLILFPSHNKSQLIVSFSEQQSKTNMIKPKEEANTANANILAQSQMIQANPHASIISQVQQLRSVLVKQLQILSQKHSQVLANLQTMKKQQAKQKKERNQQQQEGQHQQPSSSQIQPQHSNQHKLQNHETDPLAHTRNQLVSLTSTISTTKSQIKKLQQRLSLLSMGPHLGTTTHARLTTLQKIFTHYCHYIFKIGKHVTFDRIQYQKTHLIMERFFAFMHDFQLNKFYDQVKGERELVPKHQLILIFKKSGNSRNLDLTEFIACVERFAVLRYDYEETYEERREKEEVERRRVKEINARREKEREKRRKMKEEQEDRQREEEEERRRREKEEEEEERKRRELEEGNNGEVNENGEGKEESKEEKKERKKKDKDKKKKKKSDKPESNNNNSNENESESPQNGDPTQNQTGNNNNDDLLNQLMQKDSSIVNPNQEFNHLTKFNKPSQQKTPSSSQQNAHMHRQSILTLTRPQKIELLYNLIELDNPKAIAPKLRQYQKPLFKEKAELRKSSLILNSSSVSKIKETDHNHELRLNHLKRNIEDRKKEKFREIVAKSITDEKYEVKKKEDYEKYLIKSIALKHPESTDALEQRKNQLKQKNQGVQLSLNMLNQSSQHQLNSLKLSHNLKRYFHPQQDDSLYLNEYLHTNPRSDRHLQKPSKLRPSNSSFMERHPRQYSVDIMRRANELEVEERKNQEQKLERFAMQMYRNQHYMKRVGEGRRVG